MRHNHECRPHCLSARNERERPRHRDSGQRAKSERDQDAIAVSDWLSIPEGYSTFSFDRSYFGSGGLRSSDSSVSTRMLDTARFRNHFLSEGMTYHGASALLHLEM